MIFRIIRNTTFDDKNDNPVSGAYWGEYTYTEIRTVDDPAKLSFPIARENWYKEGTNHRVVNGYIHRDNVREGWLIEIKTLKQLVALHRITGNSLTLSSGLASGSDTMMIEIMDGWE